MADHEKTLHVRLTLTGEAVDQIDIYDIFTKMDDVELSSGDVKLYITPSRIVDEKGKIDKDK